MTKFLRFLMIGFCFLASSLTSYAQSDNCSPATTYNTLCVPVAGTNAGSTTGPEDSYAAADICALSIENTVWYTFTAPIADTYTITFDVGICGSAFGLQTGILTGPCGGPYTSLNCSYAGTSAITSYTFVAAAGQQVWVVIDGDGGDQCPFNMDICGTACNADAGTITVQEDGGAAASPIYLCADGTNCIDLISNNDYVLPTAQPGEIAELFYALYTCLPTTADPATDPCYSGSLWSGQDFTDCNPSTYGLTGTFYFVPITADDGDDGGDPNGAIHYDQNGDGCFDMGTPIQITYLNPITFGTPAENCYNGNVTVQINGGMPEEDGSNYTITNTGSGTIAPYTVTNGQSVTIQGLSNGQSYSFDVTDSQGCVFSFSGGPYVACACPTVDYTGLPATMSCEDAPVNLIADQTGFLAGQAVTPCYYVQVFPTNAQTGNSMTFFENAVNVGCFGPACAGGLITPNLNFSGYFSYASPSATNTVELCETTAGVDMTYAIFDCHSGAMLTSGTWLSDGACQTVAVTPPGSIDGLAVFSGTGASTTDWGLGQFDPATAGPGTHTITYSWDNENGCSGTQSYDVTVTNPHNAAYSYSQAAYCQGDSDPTPTITGETGGTFTSAPGGLSITSGTGAIDLSASTPGTYNVLYTTPGTDPCFDTLTVQVTIDPDQDGSFTYPNAAYCINDANPTPTITGDGGGTFSGPAGVTFVSTATGEIDLAGSTAGGPYTISYTTPGPCAAVGTFDVTINPLDDPTFSYSQAAYCQSDPAQNATVTGVGGGTFAFTATSGGPTLDINTGTGAITPGNSDVGVYDVTYTTPGPCVQSSTVQVTINPDQDGTFTYPNTVYCINDPNPTPTITGTAAGTFSGPAGVSFVSTATGEIDLAGSTPGGPYTISYTTPGPCAVVGTFDVTINPLDDPNFSYTQASYCESDAAQLPTITGLGGGTFSFAVTSGGPTLDINAATGEITPGNSDVGVYDVTYTTNGNCPQTSTVSVEIIVDDDPTFAYSGSTYCQTGVDPTPTITGLGGGTFSSSVVSGGPTISLNPTTGEITLGTSDLGVYDVTYTTNGPCPQSMTLQITITLAPDASFNYTGPYCQGGSPNALPTFGAGASAGTFSFSVVTGGPNLVFVSANTGEIDLGASDPGTYDVTNSIAASGGCAAASSTAQVTIDPQDDPTFTLTSPVCLSDPNPVPNITGTAGGSFSEVGGSNVVFVSAATGEIDLTSTPAGTYDIQYLTSGACPDSLTVSITINADDDPTFSYPSNQYCMDDTDPVATVTGTAGGTFSATPVGMTIDPNTGAIDLDASTGGTTYTITYQTNGLCPQNSTFTVTVDSVDDPGFTYTSNAYCSLDPNPVPTITGAGGGTFSDTTGNIVFVSTATGEIDVASTPIGGPYTVMYITSGACPDTAYWDVTITNALDATITPAGPFCSDDAPFQLTSADAGGTWSGNGVNATGLFDPAAALAAGTSPHTIYYVLGGNCGDIDSITIVVDTAYDATITNAPLSVCDGSAAVDLDAADAGGVWSGPGITDAATGMWDPSVAGPGSHQIVHTITATCGDSDTVTIVVDPVPVAPTALDQTACTGDPIPDLQAVGGGGTFNWYDDAAGTNLVGTGASFTPPVSAPGTYTYYVSETLGTCEGPLTAVTLTIGGPVADFTPSPTSGQVPLTVNFTNNSTGSIATWLWNFGDGGLDSTNYNTAHVYTAFGDYDVTLSVTDSNGCSDSYTYSFIDVDAESDIEVPNIFTPNGDQVNDLFRVEASNLVDLHGEIYNRWGHKLYEWDGTEGGWDGRTSAGEVVPDGTYFYLLTAEGADGTEYAFQGHVTLAR